MPRKVRKTKKRKLLIFAALNLNAMNLAKYKIITGPGEFYYEFYSEGPKGSIRKIVRFTPLTEYEDNYYNLYLGDWLEAEGRASDTAVSNNPVILQRAIIQ